MDRILITGASGFSAKYLTRLLLKQGDARISFTDIRGKKTGQWHTADLADPASTGQLLAAVKPDRIYHLAGSFSNNYEQDYRVNVLGTKNIFDVILKLGIECRVMLVGSAAEYGIIGEDENPVSESHPLSPASVYGLTKACQTMLMQYYHTVHGIDVVMARTFNLLGKGMSPNLFIGRLYQQIDQYKKGSLDRISVGNLESSRDYIRIQDAARCYWTIMNRGVAGEIYNVGSGKPVRIGDVLSAILKASGLDMSVISRQRRKQVNKLDVRCVYADISKLKALGVQRERQR